MPQVLNFRTRGVPEGAAYVGRGRGSKWGNPFSIGKDGDRAAVIAKHAEWLRGQHGLLRSIDELRGLDLVCWCSPLGCHADILLFLANASREERIAWWRCEAA